jgi:hypothetical protein
MCGALGASRLSDFDALADGILARPVACRESFVDHYDAGRIGVLGIAECAPTTQGYSHQPEELRSGADKVGGRSALGIGGLSLDSELSEVRRGAERETETVVDRGEFDARQRAGAPMQLALEFNTLLRRTVGIRLRIVRNG